MIKKLQQRIYAALSNAAIEAFEEMEKQRGEAANNHANQMNPNNSAYKGGNGKLK